MHANAVLLLRSNKARCMDESPGLSPADDVETTTLNYTTCVSAKPKKTVSTSVDGRGKIYLPLSNPVDSLPAPQLAAWTLTVLVEGNRLWAHYVWLGIMP